MVRLTDHLNMTTAVDWDIKQQTKLNASIYEILVLVSLASSQGSDESVLSCSFIRAFAAHIHKIWKMMEAETCFFLGLQGILK